jgi:hypothetical protein
MLIVSCGFVLPATLAFPGYAALWPVCGAVAVILAGDTRSQDAVTRLLTVRPLLWLGGISFNFYLWHWPVLVYLRHARGGAALTVQEGLAVIGVSLVGAYLTTRWIERPAMRSRIGSQRPWKALVFGATCTAPVVALVLRWYAFVEQSIRAVAGGAYPDALHPGAADHVNLQRRADRSILPLRVGAKSDLPLSYGDGCQQTITDAGVKVCRYGDTVHARTTIAVVGGSHSAHWEPAILALASEEGLQMLVLTKSSCPFNVLPTTEHPSCTEWNRRVVGVLDSLRPDVVFTTSSRADPVAGRQYVPDGYVLQWRRLDSLGLRVVGMRDVPFPAFDVPRCVDAHLSALAACAVKRESVLADNDPATQLSALPGNVTLIDLSDRLYDVRWCPAVLGNLIVYRDDRHMTASFARSLAQPLRAALRGAGALPAR